MRLIASHPSFELVSAAGEGSAGSRLADCFPWVPTRIADLVIDKRDPATLPKLDVLFAALPTGASTEALARVPQAVKVVDIGGDHRFVDGWAYGLADVLAMNNGCRCRHGADSSSNGPFVALRCPRASR
jgi:N-acetyl-gamma-glutamyl-phosphate reductase